LEAGSGLFVWEEPMRDHTKLKAFELADELAVAV